VSEDATGGAYLFQRLALGDVRLLQCKTCCGLLLDGDGQAHADWHETVAT
jgi:hypothetical protein